jgi:hypothetical protein
MRYLQLRSCSFARASSAAYLFRQFTVHFGQHLPSPFMFDARVSFIGCSVRRSVSFRS